MTLMLHAGAEPVDYGDLAALPIPEATQTHVPIAHQAVVDMVKYSLGFYGHQIVEEHFGVTPDGMRFFGVLSLLSEDGDYCDSVGLRNSHDKRFPIGISFGSRVFVCDNLAFAGDHVIRRKHTKNAKFALPSLVAEVVEPLHQHRAAQADTFLMYRRSPLSAKQADHAILRLFRENVINVQRIDDVLRAYENPPHDWGDATAYRLFNAVTHSLAGRIMETPSITAKLHAVIDDICEDAFWDRARAPIQEQPLLPMLA
ncbi:DUF945 domain-containing protein [Parerythrobacter lacustris]|uniref:DUF945 domain-containing protein n=1 Tax=Parerythrobacter lacustris TaxID=2969984 RepID=A0ABT1XST0_9SPHN|nr:DUF945 domain-containing protein [Parerythrobacter lacustris]MCR2833492.1 DUF945 domain-containing protein [Parerythrobacter lacustris]